jgi:hypothetical protein
MYHDVSGQRNYADAVRASNHACSDNELVTAFFSNQNIAVIQKTLREEVKRAHGWVISRQDDTELVLIMRGVFNMNNASVLDHDLNDQVRRLNDLVVEYTLPRLVTNIKHYIGYLRDSSRPYRLVDRPINTSRRGEHPLGNGVHQ